MSFKQPSHTLDPSCLSFVLQRNGGEGARQIPSPRLLRVLRLRRQPQTEGLLLCGGAAVLRDSRSRSDETAGGTRPHYNLPLCVEPIPLHSSPLMNTDT